MKNKQYLTIVRDLESGAVIHVGDGKGVFALAVAWEKVKEKQAQNYHDEYGNSLLFMDFRKLSQGSYCIRAFKLMNGKLDQVRRQLAAKLEELKKGQLKGLRFIFLKTAGGSKDDFCGICEETSKT